ncbi:serine hydrolase domain-containing protein [Haliangium sp.]|uniref:serine hydrolase domain-containing protein n=1 Tax=Haliangium sp. TaxID=2663208 RepID=UPI003D12FB78
MRAIHCSCLLLGLTLIGCDDEASPLPTRDPKFDLVVDVLLDELAQNSSSGLSIAVMEAGEITWAEGFGSASAVADITVEPDTTFQIGSTTKQLTAMSVLRQVDQGLYSLDDTVAEVLPEFRLASDTNWAKHATVRDLLSHQSGLPDVITLSGDSADAGLASYYYDEFAAEQWLMNPPGLFWNYANPNFDLAGLIVEEHDQQGRSYPDIIAEDLLAPLGMDRTYPRVADAHAAGGYSSSFGLLSDTVDLGTFPDWSFESPQALTIEDLNDPASQRPSGGATFSTPLDMCRWGYFLIHGDAEIASDGARLELNTAQVPSLWNDAMHYGLGQEVWSQFSLSVDPFGLGSTEYYPIRVWEHGGNTLSYTSSLVILPDHDVVISILSNGYGDAHTATQDAVLRAVLDPLPAPSDYTGPTFDPERVPELAGRYVDPNVMGEILITEGGEYGLQISIPELEERGYAVTPDLVPLSTHVWLVNIIGFDLDLTFVTNDAGELTPWLRTRQFVGKREETIATSSVRTRVRGNPTRIDALLEALRRGDTRRAGDVRVRMLPPRL